MDDTGEARTNRLRVLCPEPDSYSDAGLALVRTFADLEARSLTQKEFEELAHGYHALLVRLQLQVSGRLLHSVPTVKAVISPTTGLDHIDVNTAEALGVAVFSLQGKRDFLKTVHSTAEHTFALLLGLVRHIPAAVASVNANKWERSASLRGRELCGMRLGVIGFGRLGSLVAGYAKAFGMSVAACDPYVCEYPSYVHVCETLEDLLSTSDIVSIHVPLNEQTKNMVGRRELAMMHADAFLINTSRGAIVDEEALIYSLSDKRIAGAAVDVLTDEHRVWEGKHPMVEYARRHSNLLITPHVGGATEDAIERTDLKVIGDFRMWAEVFRKGMNRATQAGVGANHEQAR